jgi:hypothetical protein
MQSLALIVGMSGGFVGIYLALLLVIATGLFGAIASIAGSRTAAEPLYWGLGALAAYTLGVIGGALAPHRPGQAAALMFIAAVAGLIATLMVGPSATNVLSPGGSSSPTPRASAAPSVGAGTDVLFLVPFAAPLLLVIGAAFAMLERDET